MTTEPTHRCWYQFRLRTLLIVMAIAAVPFSLFGNEIRDALADRAAVNWIVQQGGSVEVKDGWLEQWIGGRVIKVDLNSTGASDLSPLTGLKNLERLSFRETLVSDLSPIAGLENLQELDFGGTQVSDLSPLIGMKNLQKLDISRTQVSDLSPLTGLKKLNAIEFHNTRVSDMSPLIEIASLEHVTLNPGKSPPGNWNMPLSKRDVEIFQKARPDCDIWE